MRDAVKEATERKQIPWSNSAVGKTDFFFKPRSWWPIFFFAALGLVSGIISSLAFAYFKSNWSDYLIGFLLGAMLASALFRWGNPPMKCLAGLAFAGLAWMMVIYAFDHTFDERSLFRSSDKAPTALAPPTRAKFSLFARKVETQKPLRAYALETKLTDGLKRTIGYDKFREITTLSSDHFLSDHFHELRALQDAYEKLFKAVKRMLFGISASVLVFACFAAPFPWLL